MNTMRVLAAAAAICLMVTPLSARQRSRNNLRPLPTLGDVQSSELLSSLRSGGYILACRHAITDRSGNQRGPVRLNDRSTQRNLSAKGEAQARALGRALKTLGIPIGNVYSSPYARTMESAQLAFGETMRDDLLYGNQAGQTLRARFSRQPSRANTVLMTHQGILRSALGFREPGEGDCVVVHPSDGTPEVVVNVTVLEWEYLASNAGRR